MKRNRPLSKKPQKPYPASDRFPARSAARGAREIIDMWDFSPGNKERIKAILASDANLQGPHLFRYYNPKPAQWRRPNKACGNSSG